MATKTKTANANAPALNLNDDELRSVAGGVLLSSAISQVMKNFGAALQNAARGG